MFKKNQHVIISTRGENGDLIVGRIDSVRNAGHVVGTNLLTDRPFTKQASVLADRNVIVPKRIADKVVKTFRDLVDGGAEEQHARQIARDFAVRLSSSPETAPPPSGCAEDSPATSDELVVAIVALTVAVQENTKAIQAAIKSPPHVLVEGDINGVATHKKSVL